MQAHRLITKLNLAQHDFSDPLIPLMREAVKFELPPIPESFLEIDATLKILLEADLLRMPYNNCYLEIVYQSRKIGLLVMDAGTNLLEHPYSNLDTAPFFKHMLTRHALYLFYDKSRLKSWEETVAVLNITNANCCSFHADNTHHVVTDANTIIQLVKFGVQMTGWLMFLLASPAISQIRYTKPAQLNKSRLLKRREPIDDYTKVMLPGFGARLKVGEAAEGEDEPSSPRKRVRLHWRRGHLRNTAYGIGRTLHKQQFIAPTLVGYEEEGRIYHLQYGQELTSEIIDNYNTDPIED